MTGRSLGGKTNKNVSGGYTILEVMLFLVISVSIIGTVVVNLNQQSRKNQFVQTVDSFQQKLQDVLNDVSTGFYPSTGNFVCSATASGPTIDTSTSAEQGTNNQCAFYGKAIQFAPDTRGADSYNVYSIIGNRLQDPTALEPQEVTSIDQAGPKLLGLSAGTLGGVVDEYNLNADVRIMRVVAPDGSGSSQNIGGIAILSDLSTQSDNTLSGNASRVSVARILNSSLLSSPNSFESATTNASNLDTAGANNGVILCLQESGDGRLASIRIGGADQQLSLSRTIDSWPPECTT